MFHEVAFTVISMQTTVAPAGASSIQRHPSRLSWVFVAVCPANGPRLDPEFGVARSGSLRSVAIARILTRRPARIPNTNTSPSRVIDCLARFYT